MVEFKIKVHEEQGTTYLPKEIRQALGLNLKVVANRAAAVVYPEKSDLHDVIRSLEILLADFRHALELQSKEQKQ